MFTYKIIVLTCVIGPGTVAAKNAIAAARVPNTKTVKKTVSIKQLNEWYSHFTN